MLDSKRTNILPLYVFLGRLMLHTFDYTIITYGYFNIRSWDKDHSTQHEMATLIIAGFFKNTMANYRKRVINCLKMLK